MSYSSDIKNVVSKFDDNVEDKFIEMIAFSVKRYRENPTRKKFMHILMNLPLGFFLTTEDVGSVFKGRDLPTYKELLGMIDNSKLAKSMFENKSEL